MTPKSQCAATEFICLSCYGSSYSVSWGFGPPQPQPGTHAGWAASVCSLDDRNREWDIHTLALRNFFLEMTHVTSAHAKATHMSLPKLASWGCMILHCEAQDRYTVISSVTGARAGSHHALCPLWSTSPNLIFLAASHQPCWVWEGCGLSGVARGEPKEPRGWLHLHLVQERRLREKAYIQSQKDLGRMWLLRR